MPFQQFAKLVHRHATIATQNLRQPARQREDRARTLRKVFAKLGISSRAQLDRVLPSGPAVPQPRQPTGQTPASALGSA
jgi:hypothetical protein